MQNSIAIEFEASVSIWGYKKCKWSDKIIYKKNDIRAQSGYPKILGKAGVTFTDKLRDNCKLINYLQYCRITV